MIVSTAKKGFGMAKEKLERCFQCNFPTKDRHKPLENSDRTIALCKICTKKIISPASDNPLIRILEEEYKRSGGRPRTKYKITAELQNRAIEMRKDGLGYVAIAKILRVSVGTIWTMCKERRK